MKNNYLVKLFVSIFSAITVVIILAFAFKGTSINKKANKINTSSYISDQYEIKDGNTPGYEYDRISIKEFYEYDEFGIYTSMKSRNLLDTEIITIADAFELYAFSVLTNEDTRFLNYRYMLTNDINYSLAANYRLQFIPIGWNSPFTGLFDGFGYEINNLQLLVFSESNSNSYEAMKYLAFFSEISSTAIIRGVGLINSDIIQNRLLSDSFIGLASLCGLNNGTIENCYVIDTRSAVDCEAGISAYGGYRISGFCFDNEGTIRNSYTYYTTVINYVIDIYIEFREFASINNGELTNCYFHNDAIKASTLSGYTNGSYSTGTLEYIGYFGEIIEASNVYGEYVSSFSELNTIFDSIDGWFTPNTNPSIKFNNTYPSLKGLYTYNNDDYTLKIEDADDFLYLFKLMNENPFFASSRMTYVLTNDIDLSFATPSSYYYNDFFQGVFTGVTNYDATVNLVNGEKPNTPTIYGISISNAVNYSGYECYGLFPLLEGEVSNINIYISDTCESFNALENSSLTKAIGVVSGYVESGSIQNVNTYSNIKLSTNVDSNNNFGRYYVGGICGTIGRKGSIINSTASGSINGMVHSNTYLSNSQSGFISGNAIGGIIGYSQKNVGEISNLLSNVSITATSYETSTSIDQYLGGCIGAGYITNFSKATNKADIITSTNGYYLGNIYMAGIIGALFGIENNINSFHNQGDLYYDYKYSNESFISGVMNVDIITSPRENLGVSSKTEITISQITNSADIIVTNNSSTKEEIASTNNINAAGICFINSKNNFKTNIIGAYNLKYKYTDFWAKDFSLEELDIDISALKSYAPCISSNASSIEGLTTLKTVYNLRELNYRSTSDLYFGNVIYSGCVIGKFVTLDDVRNQCDINVSILNNAYCENNSFKVVGVFEEVGKGCSAIDIYNGGNINIYSGSSSKNSLEINYDLYVSGICYANRNQVTSEEEFDLYNPLSDDYMGYIGSLDTIINNGSINLNTYSLDLYDSENSNGGDTAIKGDVRLSGIVSINEFIISNTFNLGNIYNASYMTTNSYLVSAGIASINLGQYAGIRDSANNGTIKAYNLSKETSFVLSSGIVAQNDCLEDSSSYGENKSHHTQLLAFCINYGEVYGFNYTANISSSADIPHSITAGVLARGLCSILNTINYGNILGSEAASGVFGVVNLFNFDNELSQEKQAIIANSINYGNVKAISQAKTVSGTPVSITFAELKNVCLDDTEFVGLGFATYGQYPGAVISIMNYANAQDSTTSSDKAQYITIRFLINFNNALSVVSTENAIPSNASSNKTLITTKENDSYMGNIITYAPLSSESDDLGNIGVFSKEFLFRKAIEGNLNEEDINSIGSSNTDIYISDYFQFIAFTKINDDLLETIGWRTLAYVDAADRFSSDLNAISSFLSIYKNQTGNIYDTLVEEALNTQAWITNCDSTVLKDILDAVLESQDLSSLQSILSYLFNNSSLITSQMRSTVIDYLIEEVNNSTTNIRVLLDNIMFDEIFSLIISESDTDYKNIKDTIINDLNTLSEEDLKNLAITYMELLESKSDDVLNIFNNDKTSINRKEMITSILSVLDEEDQSDILLDILNSLEISEGYSDTIILTTILENNKEAIRNDVYLELITVNDTQKYDLIVNNTLRKIGYDISASDSKILEKFTDSTSLSNLDNYTNTKRDYDVSSSGGATVDDSSKLTSLNISLGSSTSNNIIDYTKMWNMIKNDTGIYNYLDSNLEIVQDVDNKKYKGIYAIATEYRNSYQSNNSPSGLYGRTRTTSATGVLNHRFIYTFDDICGDGGDGHGKTYYYGPYVDASYKLLSTDLIGKSGGAENRYFVLFDNTSANTTQTYVPVFICLSESYVGELISGTRNPEVYTFVWNGAGSNVTDGDGYCQWVSTDILDSKPSDNKALLYKNTAYSDTYYYNYDNCETTTSTLERSTTTTIKGNSSALMATGTNSTSADLPYYLIGYTTASLITGIYYQQDQWETFGAYLTSKSTQGPGVLTTQFIDYSIEDLINLDGITTKGRSTGLVSADETDIINILMRYILSTNEGIACVMNAIKNKASLEDVYDTEYRNIVSMYLYGLSLDDNFCDNFLAQMVLLTISYTADFSDENEEQIYAKEGITLKDYLLSYGLPEYTYKEEIILYSTDNIDNFNILVDYLLKSDISLLTYLEGNGLFTWLNNYSTSEVEYIKEFIELQLSLGYTDSEITQMILNSNIDNIIEYVNNDIYNINSIDVTNSLYYTFSDNIDSYISTEVLDDTNSTVYLKTNNNSNGTITFTSLESVNTFRVYAAATSNTILTINSQSNTITTDGGWYEFSISEGVEYSFTLPSTVRLYYFEQVEKLDKSNILTDIDLYENNILTYDKIKYFEEDVTVSSSSFTNGIYLPEGSVISLTNTSTSNRYINFIASSTAGAELTFSSNDNAYIVTATTPTSFTSNTSYLSKSATVTMTVTSGDLYLYRVMMTNSGVSSNYGTITFEGCSTTYTNSNLTLELDTIYDSVNDLIKTKSEISINSVDNMVITTSSINYTITDSNDVSYTPTDTSYTITTAGVYTIIPTEEIQITDISYFGEGHTYNTINSFAASNAFIENNSFNKFLSGCSNYSSNEFDLYVLEKLNKIERMDISSILDNSIELSNYSINSLQTVSSYVVDKSLTFATNSYNKALILNENDYITINTNTKSRLYLVAQSNEDEIIVASLYDSSNNLVSSSIISNQAAFAIFDLDTIGEYKLTFDGEASVYDLVNVSNETLVNPYTNYEEAYNFISEISSIYSSYDEFVSSFDRAKLYEGFILTDEELYTYKNDAFISIIINTGLTKSNDYNSNNTYIWNYLSDTQIIELIRLATLKNNVTLTNLINSSQEEETIRKSITYLCGNVSSLLSIVMELSDIDINKLDDEKKLLFTSAYVGTDYSVNSMNNTLLSSILYDMLLIFDENYQFIESDTELDNDKLLNFMQNLLNLDLTTEGYGIYALSSSEGILNGNFIPDNVPLEALDVNYTLNASNVYVLTDVSSSSWRGEVSNTNSVTYAFSVDMKQLKKSIATSVFYIELISDSGVVITTPDELIDLENNKIDFYLPSNADGTNLTYRVNTDNVVLSYMATISASSTIDASSIDKYDTLTFTVTAEDTTVSKEYTVYLYKSVNMSMTLQTALVDSNTSTHTRLNQTYTLATQLRALNGNIDLTFNTVNIPNYTNLSNIIYLDGLKYNEENSCFSFITDPVVSTNNSSFNTTNKTWGNGSVRLNISFDNMLSSGSHTLEIRLSSSLIYKVVFTREETVENEILSITLDGVVYTPTNYIINSYISFGRGYSYDDLTTVENNIPAYLDDISLSERARIEIVSATISTTGDYSDYIYTNGILTYTVTLRVYSESGSQNVYTHNLIENEPFIYDINDYDPNYYVTLIKDGETVNESPNDDGSFNISFAREDEYGNELSPKYRFNYYLDRLYVSGSDIVEQLNVLVSGETSTSNGEITVSYEPRFYGYYVNFYESAKAGNYDFVLKYSNTDINWNNTTYSRVLNCPTITITKELSTDSYLKEIHFLQNGGQLSDSATIASLTEITTDKGDGHDYDDLINSPEPDVVSNLGTLSYNTNDAINATKYYIVGTVSDAQLSTYAPDMEIKSYSRIYQFKRFDGNDNRYLYVEFEYLLNDVYNKQCFLVDESFSNVWDVNVENPMDSSKLSTITNNSFTYKNITYTISSVAGTTSALNTGLNMDYIGTPEEHSFWYVGYVIFSESYKYDNSLNYCREYYIAVLDMTNNVKFEITINDISSNKLNYESIYITIAGYQVFGSASTGYYLYDNNNLTNDTSDDTMTLMNVYSSFAINNGNDTYLLEDDAVHDSKYGFVAIPYYYFYFYIDLPDGYACSYEIITANKDNLANQWGDESYLAPTSIITQKIEVEFTIYESENASFAWGEKVLAVLPSQSSKKDE